MGRRIFSSLFKGPARQVETPVEALLSAGANDRVYELEIRSTFHRTSRGYLRGHRINVRPVVPMVLGME